MGSSLYKPELFDGFLSFTSGESTAADLILSGLVFCREDKIRQDFCQGVLALARSIEVGKRQLAQQFFMGILGTSFTQIGGRLCSQYFDLFNELLDL